MAVDGLNTKEVSELTGLAVNTLSQYRVNGRGPKFYHLDPANPRRGVRYMRADVEAWMESRNNV